MTQAFLINYLSRPVTGVLMAYIFIRDLSHVWLMAVYFGQDFIYLTTCFLPTDTQRPHYEQLYIRYNHDTGVLSGPITAVQHCILISQIFWTYPSCSNQPVFK